ncbi:MAG TPA: hypothetical protein VHK28_08450, partial [Candidatus Limnocylindria bacterium]|nr:hypothetical protein [Candidatus Limnocylindria bacterium]
IDPLPPQVVPPRDEGVGVPIPLVLLWSVLPDGGLGWVLALALLAGVVAISIAQRRTPAPALAVARAGLVVALLVIGLAVGAREAVAVANRAPPDAAGMQNPLEASEGSIARGRGLYLANCAVSGALGAVADGAVGQVEAASPGD